MQLLQVLDSPAARQAAIDLQGSNAQDFLDGVQNVLDFKAFPTAKAAITARRLILRLSESTTSLPSALFITETYAIDHRPLFSGGFAEIYRATTPQGQHVALKRIRIQCFTPENRHFMREAIVLHSLQHPLVLPFLGVVSDAFPSSLCMVSPWMAHGNIVIHILRLAHHGQECNRLELIAQAVEYLHSMNVVHGDLKGANIMITDDGHACLCDFGLADFFHPDITDELDIEDEHKTGKAMGSVQWLAPELLNPQRFGFQYVQRTQATDIYAFACVCIELETCAPPFPHHPDSMVFLDVVEGVRPKRPETMSDVVWNMVDASWAGNPRQRPTARHISRLLKGLNEGHIDKL
ncbi:kinase-like domain-containing protein [Favolaschia claudopus]|uniref:Kinase-like domain-containing protein n=1 Tax=Favolaschia claudopus TaxID=2862362 RepID=A0AAW0C9X6_9AGAR